MTNRSWIRKLFSQPVTRPIRRSALTPEIGLEPLEDRCLLDATVTGTPAADQFHVRPGTLPGSVVVSSDNGTFAPETFPDLTGTLYLFPGSGNDTITIDPLGNSFTGEIQVSDPDTVTLNNISMRGTLTVSAVDINAANGAIIQSSGDINLTASDTTSQTFPLDNPLSRDLQASAGITIGSATITANNINLSSSAATQKQAQSDLDQDTRAVALADVNGDGRPDLITVATDPGTGGGLGGALILFLNTGLTDPFDGSIPQTICRGDGMTSVAVGDVTGDGRPDLVVGSAFNPNLPGTQVFSRLFVNTGTDVPFQFDPTYNPAKNLTYKLGTGTDITNSVALADVNGDGKLDLVMGNGVGVSKLGAVYWTSTRLYLNQGGQNPFAGPGIGITGQFTNTVGVALADVNGDNMPDLIVANAFTSGAVASSSFVYLNQGGADPFRSDLSIALPNSDKLPVTSVATGDLDGNGRTDIVLGVNGQPSQAYYNFPDLEFPSAPLGTTDTVKGLAVVDVNGDGKMDVVTAVAGVSRVYLSNGFGKPFTEYDLVSDGFEMNGVADVAAADLNGDGRPDLAIVGEDVGPQLFINDGATRPYTAATLETVSLDPSLTTTTTLPFLESTSEFASAVVSKADSTIIVNGGASLSAIAGNVVIDSEAVAAAINSTIGVFVGFTYADVEPTAIAELLPGAKVTATGAFELLARTNTVLNVSVTTVAPMVVNIDIAYGRSRSTADANIAAGAFVTAGSATVLANASNSLSTTAGGYNLTFNNLVASGGVGIAVTDYASTANANVNGNLTVTNGDAQIEADATNTANTTEASASVLSVTRSLLSAGQSIKGIGDAVKKLAPATASISSVLQGGGSLLGLLAGGTAQFAAAAGIAWVNSTLTANAGVAGRVTVRGQLGISSETEDNIKVIATGSAGNADVASLGGGLAVTTINNTATSTVAPNADLAVGGLLHVVSNAVVPNPISSNLPPSLVFVPPPDITGTPTSNNADRVANAYQMGQATADGFAAYMANTIAPIITGILFGNVSSLGTTFVKGTGSAENSQSGSVGIGGGINVFLLTNTSTATIGNGAKVNQRSPGPDVSLAQQDVWVEADTTVITINLGNQVAGTNLPNGGAGATGAAAVGGQFEYISLNNKAQAYIDNGAQVTAGRDLKITSNTFNYLMTVIQAGAKAQSVGVGGTLSIQVINNQSLAYAEDGATLIAGRDLQVLAGNQLQVFNAGGAIIQGGDGGFGLSAAVNLLQQNDTLAFLGDNNGSLQAGSASAGRNLDVKATADTLVVGVAFSGASANGLGDQLSEPEGPDTFASFKEWGAAQLAYLQSLDPKGGIGASGDAVINGLVSNTQAYIRGIRSVTAGNNLTVAANDTSLFAAASGAVAIANSKGFAGSSAVNTVNRTTAAFVDGATTVKTGSLAVTANSVETPVTVSAGAGISKEDAAVAGSVNVTAVTSTTSANLSTTTSVTTTRPSTLFDRGGVTVQASHSLTNYSVAGVVAGTLNGAAAVGLAVDIALLTANTTANLGGQVTSAGDLQVFATDSETLFGVAAGLAAALTDGTGAAGSVTLGSITQSAIASIAKNARVNVASSARVDADGRLYDLRVAGGVGGGKTAGVGGAATINLVPNRTILAVIDDSAQVRASGANGLPIADPQGVLGTGIVGLAVNAGGSDTFLLFAAAGAVSPGTLALAGTVTVDLITNNSTESRIGANTAVGYGDNPNSAQSIAVTAGQQTNALTVAGSLAGAKTAGVGVAAVIETIDRNVQALVDQSAVVSAKGVAIVDATSGLQLTSVAGALAGGKDAAVAGSTVVQTLTTTTLAAIGASARIEAGVARVTADNTVTSTPVAGQVAGSLGVGIGASSASIIETDSTIARIGDGAQITTTGGKNLSLDAPTGRRFANGSLIRQPTPGLAVVATAQENLTPVAVGAAGGRVGLAGSLSLSVLNLTTQAIVGQGDNLQSPLSLIAADDTHVTGSGGAAAFGATAGVGAGLDVQSVTKRVSATVNSSASRPTTINSTRPGDVSIIALSTGTQTSTSAAVGIGLQAGLAGGANGLNVDNATLATVGPSAVITSQSNLIVSAEDTTNISTIAGALSAGKAAGVGAAAGVTVVNKDTEATVGTGAKLTANSTGPATLVDDGGFQAGAPDPVGGTFSPTSDVSPAFGTIRLPSHQFTPGAGQAVIYRAGDAAPDIGLVDGQTYYVIVVTPDLIRLASTPELARAGISDVSLRVSSQTNTTSSLLPVGKGPIDVGSATPVTDQVSAILARRTLVPTQQPVVGVAVTAVNLDRIESYTAAGGGGTVAVQLAVAADIITSKAIANIGTNADVTATNVGRVLVSAGNELFHLGAAGAVGVGKVAVAPGFHIPVANLTTSASIGSSARVTAGSDVQVMANASEDLLSLVVGLAGSLGASVGGSASIVSVTSNTSATTGTLSSVRAGGSVIVTANDATRSGIIDGAAAVGALGGLGGAVGVDYVEKTTLAALGARSTTSGDAVDGSSFLAVDSTQPLSGDNPPTRSLKGVLVQAVSTQDLFAVGAAGAGGKFGGLAGAVTVGTVNTSTTATVGDGAQVNAKPAVSGRPVAADQDVAVTAVDITRAFGAAGALAGAGGAIAGGVDVVVVKPYVEASVGTNAAVAAARDVAIGALSKKDIQSAAISAAGGAVGVAGAVSVVNVGSDGLASDAQQSLKANDSGNSATTTGYLDDQAQSSDLTSLLGDYRSNPDSSDAEKLAAAAIGSLSTSVQAARPIDEATDKIFGSGGGFTVTLVSGGSTISAGRAVAISGRDRVTLDQTTGTLAAGLAAFGGAVGVSSVSDIVNVVVIGNISAGGNVSVASDYDSNLGGGAGAGLGTSNGVTVGLIGIGAQVTRMTDNAINFLSLNGSVSTPGSVTVDATRNRTLNANAQGVTAGGVVVGVAQAQADAGGSNGVTISGEIGNSSQPVNNFTLNARSLTLASANTKAVAAGVVSGAGSDARVSQTSSSPDTVTLNGARIAVANDASVIADSEQQSQAFADGLNVGALTVGVSIASATSKPDVRVLLTGLTLSAGRDVTIYSSAQAQSQANATASGGGVLIGGGAIVSSTSSPYALLNTSSSFNGQPTRVSAGRAINMFANDGVTAIGSALSPSYGFASVGSATATGTQVGTGFVDIGPGTNLTAGTDLSVTAFESQAIVNGSSLVGFLDAGFTKTAAASFTKSSTVTVFVGNGAAFTAGNRLIVSAGTGSTTYVESTAPIGQFFIKPAFPSTATTDISSIAAVHLNNSVLSGRDVSLSATSNERVSNVGNGSTSIFTGGDVLKQFDTVSVSAFVDSGDGFVLNSSTLATNATATASAIGSTNGNPRTTIDALTRLHGVVLNGRINVPTTKALAGNNLPVSGVASAGAVVPIQQTTVEGDYQRLLESVGALAARLVNVLKDRHRYSQADLRARLRHVVARYLQSSEYHAAAGPRRVLKQLVSDRVVLRAIERIVRHSDLDPESEGQLLELFLENIPRRTVAATAVAQDQDLLSSKVLPGIYSQPIDVVITPTARPLADVKFAHSDGSSEPKIIIGKATPKPKTVNPRTSVRSAGKLISKVANPARLMPPRW